MAERLGALGLAVAAWQLATWAAGPAAFVDFVLVVGWGHLLGAALGDARRVRARLPAASGAGLAALATLGLATAIAAASPALAHPLVQATLIAGVFLHVFENEARAVSGASGPRLAPFSPSIPSGLGALAPTLALGLLVVAARSPAEARAFDPPGAGASALTILAVVLAVAALASETARGRGAAALFFLAVAEVAPSQGWTRAADVVALASLYHFLRFALRQADTRLGRRRCAFAHAVPAAIVAAGAVPPLAPLAAGLLEPGLFLLGAFLHGVHTTAVRAFVRPRAA
ncbi:MAG: hypothetical protein QNK05_11195 [Myxococcota bacterium]|nr:hypothetical protein [Myxococcota bacterium]